MDTTDVGPHARVPALDGLRGVAILLVLFFHFTNLGRLILVAQRVGGVQGALGILAWNAALSGWAGVDLFFVLSGYLITGILLQEKGRPRFFRRFYARRAARILPLYYVFLAGYAVVLLVVGSTAKLGALVWPLLYATNIPLGLFGDGAIPHEIQCLWSLAIEEQFYLVFPLIIVAVSRPWLRAICVLGVLVALAFRFAMRPDFPLVAFLTPSRFDGLLVGAFLATVLGSSASTDPAIVRGTRIGLAIASVVFGAFLVWRGGLPPQDAIVDVFGRLPLILFFGALVAGCVALPGSVLARVLELAPLRFFGRYSYAMYMLHMAVMAGLFKLHIGIGRLTTLTGSLVVGYLAFLTIATALTAFASLVSYYVLERPFLALRDRSLAAHG